MTNDYYVYAHTDIEGDIFYIGSGRKDRAKRKGDMRSKLWNDYVNLNGTDIKITYLHEELSIESARELEQLAIDYHKPVCNSNIVAKTRIITESVKDYVTYDTTSSTGLRYIKTGKEAGSRSFRGNGEPHYIKVDIQCARYKVHRLVYFLCKGAIPKNFVVDHLDGNPFNNKIENLELKPQSCNSRNVRKGIDRKLPTGVGYARNKDRNYVIAYWNDIKGVRQNKYFNIDKQLLSVAIELATDYRNEQIRLLNAQGAGYTARHGT